MWTLKHPLILIQKYLSKYSELIYIVRMSFGKFRKVIGIDNAVFQYLEHFGKGKFFKIAMEKFWIFVWEILKYPEMDVA